MLSANFESAFHGRQFMEMMPGQNVSQATGFKDFSNTLLPLPPSEVKQRASFYPWKREKGSERATHGGGIKLVVRVGGGDGA